MYTHFEGPVKWRWWPRQITQIALRRNSPIMVSPNERVLRAQISLYHLAESRSPTESSLGPFQRRGNDRSCFVSRGSATDPSPRTATLDCGYA